MFVYFFEEYKEKIYKGSRRKLKWYGIVFVLMIIALLLFVLSLFLNWGGIVICTEVFVFILLIVVASILDIKDFQRNRESLLKGYKENHIEPLCQQLKEYKLYTDTGIEWLIDCCKKRTKRSQDFAFAPAVKSFFVTVVYPLITLTLGYLLKDMSVKAISSFAIGLVTILFIGAIAILCLQLVVLFVLFPDTKIVEYLEADLEYIKTRIQDEQK